MKATRILFAFLVLIAAGCRSASQLPDTSSFSAVSKPSVYLASPLGFAKSTTTFLYNELIPTIESTGVTVRNPWKLEAEAQRKLNEAKEDHDLRSRRSRWIEVIDMVGATNDLAIKMSDGVVAVLDGVDVDSGTAAEIGYAASLGKWVIGYRSDFRRAGDDETAEVNLQVEYFIRKNGGLIVHTLPELKTELQKKAGATEKK